MMDSSSIDGIFKIFQEVVNFFSYHIIEPLVDHPQSDGVRFRLLREIIMLLLLLIFLDMRLIWKSLFYEGNKSPGPDGFTLSL